MKPHNCRCHFNEMEISCTKPDSDYDTVKVPEKKIIRIDDFEAVKEYNRKMKDSCPDFKSWPESEEELEKAKHEWAIKAAGGVENLNMAKVMTGEMTPEEFKKSIKKE